MNSTDKPRAYIAFQGGGALGMAHLGAWQEIAKQFRIVGTAGTSSGSIVASFCAAGFEPAHAIDRFYELDWFNLLQRQNFLRLLIDQNGYSDGRRVRNWLRGELGKNLAEKTSDVTFAQLYGEKNIYLAVIACDLNSHPEYKPVLFDSTTDALVSHAVRASISIPGLLKPVPDDKGRELVDGGILDNFPVKFLYDRAKSENCTLIGVHFRKSKITLESPRFWQTLKRTYEIMIERGSEPPKEIARDPEYIDIEIDVSGFKPFNFNLTGVQKKELLVRGTQAAKVPLLEYQLRIQRNRLSRIEEGLEITEAALLADLEPDLADRVKVARDFLFSNIQLSSEVGKVVLEDFHDLEITKEIERLFCLDIQHYLERIYRSLYHQDIEILRNTRKLHFPRTSAYIKALELIRSKIPTVIDRDIKQQIEDRIDFLKGRIADY